MDFSIQFEFQTQKEAVCITDGLLDENKTIKHIKFGNIQW